MDFRSREQATRLDYPAERRRRWNLFGGESEVPSNAQAFLVELAPGRTVPTHFHGVNQFQVFHASNGARYQGHEMSGDTLHYVDAYKPYGPFSSGSSSALNFAVLRPIASKERWLMPSEREELAKHQRGKRSIIIPIPRSISAIRDGKFQVTALIPIGDDGLAVSVATGDRGVSGVVAIPSRKAGRMIYVLNGAVSLNGQVFNSPAAGWSRGRRETLVIAADKTRMLFLDFP